MLETIQIAYNKKELEGGKKKIFTNPKKKFKSII